MTTNFGLLRISRRAARLWLTTVALAFFISPARAALPVTVVPLAVQGHATPDGNGVYGDYFHFGDPCLNDSAQVGFYARLTSTTGGSADDETLQRIDAAAHAVVLAREGQPLPDGTGNWGRLFTLPRMYVMNNAGRLAFVTDLTGTPGGSADNAGLFSSAGPGTVVTHLRRGAAAPGTAFTVGSAALPVINNEMPAAVAAWTYLGPSNTSGLALYLEQGGTLHNLTVFGRPAPDGNGSVSGMNEGWPVALRPDAPEVFHDLHFSGTALGSQDDDGIFRLTLGSPAGLTQLARGHGAAPGGGLYAEFDSPVCNIAGNTAFVASRNPTSDGPVLVRAGAAGAVRICGRGVITPDANGSFSDFASPALSAGNLVAYRATLTGTVGGGSDDTGIYRGDGLLNWQVAREGQPVPEGGGWFSDFGTSERVAINAAGQVLFIARLAGTPGGTSDNRGLYLWDDVTGLTKILRLGDVINGSTVTDFAAITAPDYGGFRSLNDAGEAVARVRLGKGFPEPWQDGIYLFRTAEPVAAPRPGSMPAQNRLALVAATGMTSTQPVRVIWSLAGPAPRLRVSVLDVRGREVCVLLDGPASARGELAWDGRVGADASGGSGIYLIRAEAGTAQSAVRVVRTR